jgi:anti-sigma regulatory factor (Ser/Thr protein kinase)
MSVRPLRPRRVGELERQYGGTTGSLREVRNDLVRWLKGHGAGDDLCDRAALVVSELASNAVQAAPDVPYRVRVSFADGKSLVVAITSHTPGHGPPPRGEWGPPTLMAAYGRGLLIVDELSDDVVVQQPAADTVVVTATLR